METGEFVFALNSEGPAMAVLAVSEPRKLPVFSTVGACYAIMVRNLGQLIRMSWLWFVIMLPAYAAAHWLTWPCMRLPQALGLPCQLAGKLTTFIELPALASIAVAWHRLVLRDESVSGAFYLRLDHMVWRYALVLLVFGALTHGALLLYLEAIFTGNVWAAMAVLAAVLAIPFFVLPRATLILPALAVEERLSVASAWHATRGNAWRLAWATLLCIVPLVASWYAHAWLESQAACLILHADGRLGIKAACVAFDTMFSLFYVLITMIAVTLISLVFGHFISPSGPRAAAAA